MIEYEELFLKQTCLGFAGAFRLEAIFFDDVGIFGVAKFETSDKSLTYAAASFDGRLSSAEYCLWFVAKDSPIL